MKTFHLLYLNIIAFFSIPFFFVGCNFLDIENYYTDELEYDSIFHTQLNFEKYLWGTATFLPDESAVLANNYTPGPLATDEAFSLSNLNTFRGMAYVLGYVEPTNLMGMDIWSNMYKIIRKCNTMLTQIDKPIDMTDKDKNQLLGYIHMLRGYAYYHLLMQYGPFVIIGDDVMDNNESAESYDKARSTYDECVEYICEELEAAAKTLPSEVPLINFGKPTKGAAYGLIARLRLQNASALFNGQNAALVYFGDWKRKTDGINYINQSYDEYKWAKAAHAAKRIIDTNDYELHTVPRSADSYPLPSNVSSLSFPNGAGDIDPFRSYSDLFTGETTPQRNKELIWAVMSNNFTYATSYSFPVILLGGWNNIAVPQKIIDNYYMANGKNIHSSTDEYRYVEDGFIGGGGKVFSGYKLMPTASRMYDNREMRFYASIGFSECLWLANSTSETQRKNIPVTYYYDGIGGKANVTSIDATLYPITGYVCKKFIHQDDAWAGFGAQRIQKAFPIIRYAEVLLSYVEALNNLTVSHTVKDIDGNDHIYYRNVEEMKFYFNQIRYRAGLPGLTDEEAASPQIMQKLIERERLVEFLFENRRYYDVRRWGIYEETESEMMIGMNTDSYKDGYYARVPLNSPRARNRVVDKKLVFMPINLNEIRKAPSLDQNPGWQN